MDKNVVVVTGAASGMGLETARRLLREDRILVLVDLDVNRLEVARDDLAHRAAPDAVRIAQVDVSDEAAVRNLAVSVASHGPLEILAHAAGISPAMADWRTLLSIDLVGTAIVLDAFLPLAGRGSVAVCWASSAAYMGAVGKGDTAIDAVLDDPRAPDLLDRLEAVNGEQFNGPGGTGAAYGWAKRAVIRLIGREAARWGSSGARLISVSPGIVDTPMARFEYDNSAYMRALIAAAPIPRMGRMTEIAELVSFLTSPDASFITGTDILIDGGSISALPPRQ